MPAVVPSAVTLGVGGLIVLAATAGGGVLLLAVVAAQALIAYGLVLADEFVDASRDGVLIALAGAVGAIALRIDDNPTGLTPSLGPVAYVVGPAVLIALMLRLVRSARRDHLVEAFALTVTGVALVGMLAVLVELRSLHDGRDLVSLVVGCAALAALPGIALRTPRVPAWAWWSAKGVGLLAAAAFAMANLFDLESSLLLAVGAAATVAGALGAEVAVRLSPSLIGRAALVPTIAISLAGPPAYVLARVLLG